MGTTTFSIIHFMMKTHSICVYGQDLSPHLPDYKADKLLGNVHLSKLKKQIELAREDLVDNDDLDDIKDCCGWIKKTLFEQELLLLSWKKIFTREICSLLIRYLQSIILKKNKR